MRLLHQPKKRQERREAKDSKEEEAAPQPSQPPAVQPPDWSREEVTLWMACCLLFLARDEEARTLLASLSAATRASPLALRVALVLRVKETGACSEEDAASLATQEPEDRICLAAVRCLLTDYEAAARELQRASEAASSGPDSPDLACLAVYLALVYHRVEYIEVSQQLLAPYLRSHADSTMAGNLFACNEMRLSKRGSAEATIRRLIDARRADLRFGVELLRHNLAILGSRESAEQLLPPLLPVLREARVNLAIDRLRHRDPLSALRLVTDTRPESSAERHVWAVVYASCALDHELAVTWSSERRQQLLTQARNWFQEVGSAAAECDTIPGRQCMASAFFLRREMSDVLLYLSSIASYFFDDDAFAMNYAQAKASASKSGWRQARERLDSVRDPRIRSSPHFLSWMTRSLVMTRDPESAWQLMHSLAASSSSSGDQEGKQVHLTLLLQFANDCYRVGLFGDAMRAFVQLDGLEGDSCPEYWEATRGSAAGQLQLVVAGRASPSTLDPVMRMLRDSSHQPEARNLASVIRDWISAQDHFDDE